MGEVAVERGEPATLQGTLGRLLFSQLYHHNHSYTLSFSQPNLDLTFLKFPTAAGFVEQLALHRAGSWLQCVSSCEADLREKSVLSRQGSIWPGSPAKVSVLLSRTWELTQSKGTM